jgi:hypothetical protein
MMGNITVPSNSDILNCDPSLYHCGSTFINSNGVTLSNTNMKLLEYDKIYCFWTTCNNPYSSNSDYSAVQQFFYFSLGPDPNINSTIVYNYSQYINSYSYPPADTSQINYVNNSTIINQTPSPMYNVSGGSHFLSNITSLATLVLMLISLLI